LSGGRRITVGSGIVSTFGLARQSHWEHYRALPRL
jgi:hypothetical protein